MAWCHQCERYFVNEDALQQHLDNAAIHRPVYHCDTCDVYFSNAHALNQHEENSVKHLRRLWNYVCDPCKLGWDKLELFEEHEVKYHNWCKMHDRYFNNANELNQHNLSKAHGTPVKCPGCNLTFPTYFALTLHLESGTCASGANRRKVDQRVHEIDRSGSFTNPKLIGYGEWEPEPDIWATQRAWNGYGYECYFCDNVYNTLGKLNGHITRHHAPKRTENIYNCPACGRQFRLFSQLVGHVEQTGTCNVREQRGFKGLFNGGGMTRMLTMG